MRNRLIIQKRTGHFLMVCSCLLFALNVGCGRKEKVKAEPFDTARVIQTFAEMRQLKPLQALQYAQLLIRREQPQRVIRVLRKQGNKRSLEMELLLAEAYSKLGGYDSALYFLDRIREDLQELDHHHRASLILMNAGKYRIASDEIGEAIRYHDKSDYLLTKAKLDLLTGDTVTARRYLQMIEEKGAAHLRADLLEIYKSLKDYDRLEVLISQGELADPEFLLQYYIKQEQLDTALYFAQSLDTPATFKKQIEIYKMMDKLASAYLVAEQWIASDSSEARAWLVAGDLADARYRYGQAAQLYRAALQRDSLNQEASEKLGTVYQKIRYLQRIQRAQDTTSNGED